MLVIGAHRGAGQEIRCGDVACDRADPARVPPGAWLKGDGKLLYRGVDHDGQVLDRWLSQTPDLAAALAFFRRTISSTGCTPQYVVTDKAAFYPSAIRTYVSGAKHTATGFYNVVISTNRCERNHGYLKTRIRPMRGLKSFACATRLFPALNALQLVERDFVRVPPIGAPCTGGRSLRARPPHRGRHHSPGPDLVERNAVRADCVGASGPHANVGKPPRARASPLSPNAPQFNSCSRPRQDQTAPKCLNFPVASSSRTGALIVPKPTSR
jgi:DDE domain